MIIIIIDVLVAEFEDTSHQSYRMLDARIHMLCYMLYVIFVYI